MKNYKKLLVALFLGVALVVTLGINNYTNATTVTNIRVKLRWVAHQTEPNTEVKLVGLLLDMVAEFGHMLHYMVVKLEVLQPIQLRSG